MRSGLCVTMQHALLSKSWRLEAVFPASKLLEFFLPLDLAVKDVLGREVSWGTAWLLGGRGLGEREKLGRDGELYPRVNRTETKLKKSQVCPRAGWRRRHRHFSCHLHDYPRLLTPSWLRAFPSH